MLVYQGNFTCWNDVQREFNISYSENGKLVLLAAYETPDYEGYPTVLYFEGGKFFIVEGGHCSCYGLEGQFEPKETSLPELLHRMEHGHFYGADIGPVRELFRKLAKDGVA